MNKYSKKKIGDVFRFMPARLPHSIPAHKIYGQAIIEFCFCMVIFVLMVYSATMFLKWIAPELVRGTVIYDDIIINGDLEAAYTVDPVTSVVFGE